MQAARDALEQGQFELVYQPIMTPDGRFAHAAEALLRWTDTDLRVHPAASFLPALELTGAIVEVEAWALTEVCRQLALWRLTRDPEMRVHLNVAPLQLLIPGFSDSLIAALAAAGLPHSAVALEIREPVLVRTSDAMLERLRELHELGFQIWADNFGTGLCSLSYLRQVPVTGIKIDRRHIVHLAGKDGDPGFIGELASLARSYGIEVMAEGVEVREQVKALAKLGVNRLQGFLLAAPMRRDTFEQQFLG